MRGLAALALVGTGLALGPAPAPAYAAEVAECLGLTDIAQVTDDSKAESAPYVGLQMQDVKELAEKQGGGPPVGISVIGSGITPPAAGRLDGSGSVLGGGISPVGREIVDPTTTVVMGLLTGEPRGKKATGFAPSGTAVNAFFSYDSALPVEDGKVAITPAYLLNGLRNAAATVSQLSTRIVVVPTPVGPLDKAESKDLLDVVKELTKKKVVVIAASGDVPTTEGQPLFGDFSEDATEGKLGVDAATASFPSAFDQVLSVASTASDPEADPSGTVLPNSQIDVAVPTAGAVSYGINGKACDIAAPSTAFAAAEVAGIVATLMQAFPDDNGKQVVARLERTSTGGAVEASDPFQGHGIVQPIEAIKRDLSPSRKGELANNQDAEQVRRALAPRDQEDILADTREKAIWWGLIGGGALVVAALLRPVLACRRRD